MRSIADVILQDINAAKGAALTTSLLLVGIVFAIALADIVGRISLQVFGFLGCAVGLFLASLSAYFSDGERLLLIFAGFMLFNFMTNLGPNAQTYLLAGEVFPTAIRGKGAGFAAAFAKIGAVMTAFLFPVMLDTVGTQVLLYGLIVTSVLGAAITWFFRIETTGVNLDTLNKKNPARRRPGGHGCVASGPSSGWSLGGILMARHLVRLDDCRSRLRACRARPP